MKPTQLKINLFEEFWKYVFDRDHVTDDNKKQVADKVKTIVDCLGELGTPTTLGSKIWDKCLRIEGYKRLIDFEPGVMPPFVMQQDPTVLFAGIPSGRNEKSSGKSLLVRLGGQESIGLDDTSKNAKLHNWAQMIDSIKSNGGLQGKISSDLVEALASLLKETTWLSDSTKGSVPADSSMKGSCWDGQQAWYPLFVEWTVEYYHIPITDWEFNLEVPEGENEDRINPKTIQSNDPNIQGDFRILSASVKFNSDSTETTLLTSKSE